MTLDALQSGKMDDFISLGHIQFARVIRPLWAWITDDLNLHHVASGWCVVSVADVNMDHPTQFVKFYLARWLTFPYIEFHDADLPIQHQAGLADCPAGRTA
jgi:hypothetical protein